MPVYQALLNLNDFYNQLRTPPIIINDMANATESDKELVAQKISTAYSSDMITMMPSCRCGETKGEVYIGELCDNCHEPVSSSIEDDVEPIVWFRRPNGVAPLLNITVWTWLKQRFTKSGFNLIQWLTDPRYSPTVKRPPVIDKLISAGIPRGYNNFVENFDNIIAFLFTLKEFKPKKARTSRDYLQELLIKERANIFSDYLPLPNKTFLLIEKTNMGIFIDPIVINAMDAITMMVSIDKNFYDQASQTKQNRTARALNSLSDFHEKYMRTNLCPKQGQFRRHVFGSRTNFSFRAVITSIEGPHKYNELHVPWAIGLTAFRPHVIGKLSERGFDLNSSIGLIMSNIHRYNPLLDTILEEIINEAPNKSIPCVFQRNPSLLQASAQLLGITKFKKDPGDTTVSLSNLVIKGPNADFDGDACNFSIALDKFMADKWYPLEPHFNVYHLDKPYKVCSNIAIPKPVIATIGSWLQS